ncbi:BON domain-containing protein [Streptomyces sp. NPDC127106]|uniref:BON domain-containing protein n=1 Tax=Streptomyces sp. NPDC127106 TaxID=3345360 RepID=UPI00362B7AE8
MTAPPSGPGHRPAAAPAAGAVTYRIERLRERLAHDDVAELGVQIDLHGGVPVLSGTVTTPACRATVLRIAAEELAGLPWRHDVRLVSAQPPAQEQEEDLS